MRPRMGTRMRGVGLSRQRTNGARHVHAGVRGMTARAGVAYAAQSSKPWHQHRRQRSSHTGFLKTYFVQEIEFEGEAEPGEQALHWLARLPEK